MRVLFHQGAQITGAFVAVHIGLVHKNGRVVHIVDLFHDTSFEVVPRVELCGHGAGGLGVAGLVLQEKSVGIEPLVADPSSATGFANCLEQRHKECLERPQCPPRAVGDEQKDDGLAEPKLICLRGKLSLAYKRRQG